MRLDQIDLENIRIVESARLEPGAGINLLYGKNGSGKTSILEAIYLLSRARSFRTPKIRELIQNNKNKLLVTAKAVSKNGEPSQFGLEREGQETRIRFRQKRVIKTSDQAKNVPVLVQSTDSHSLLTGMPRLRRRWLDWLMFHVEPAYLTTWKGFHSALRSRNKLLREGGKPTELAAWEAQMGSYGEALFALCERATETINACFQTEIKGLLSTEAEVNYQSGWEQEESYACRLKKNREKDRDRGHTSVGPHRADLQFLFEGEQASKILSRGQSKLYLTALIFAELKTIEEATKNSPVLLIDDVAAELDSESREKVAAKLDATEIQSFITTTEPDIFEQHTETRFHVERGVVKKMI